MAAMATTRTLEPWDALLDEGRADERLVTQARAPARAADSVPVPATCTRRCATASRRAGIESLYAHQAQALEAAAGHPVVVTTGTASGKSLCFNLPASTSCAGPARPGALPLPDQGAGPGPGPGAARLRAEDAAPGDLRRRHPARERAAIRKRANVVLTNPDMLHVGILPNHGAWGELFANLAAVVVDEAHVYRGVFGSHVGNVLRRLRRIAAAYGTDPRFLLA